MNYKTVQGEKNCSIYNVVETTTNQVIKTFKDHKDAKEFMRHLNLGGGFDGFSPTFILKSVTSNINK
jgi:hypothetical protein